MPSTAPIFSCDPGLYVRAVGLRGLRRWAWLPIAAAAVAGWLAVSDVRFAYVLLMLIFIVYPMALSMAWMALTGRPWFNMAIRPQRWTFGSEPDCALTVEFYRFEGEDHVAVAEHRFTAGQIERIDRRKSYTYVWMRGGAGFPLLIVPAHLTPKPSNPLTHSDQ